MLLRQECIGRIAATAACHRCMRSSSRTVSTGTSRRRRTSRISVTSRWIRSRCIWWPVGLYASPFSRISTWWGNRRGRGYLCEVVRWRWPEEAWTTTRLACSIDTIFAGRCRLQTCSGTTALTRNEYECVAVWEIDAMVPCRAAEHRTVCCCSSYCSHGCCYGSFDDTGQSVIAIHHFSVPFVVRPAF